MQQIYSGKVNKGEGRGKKLGYPTANINIDNLKIDVKPGVYASTAWLNNNQLDNNNKNFKDKKYQAILFYGPKKTFNKVENTLEIHILNFNQDLYEKVLNFTIGKFIRQPIKFNSVEELVKQIKEDITKV